MLVDSENVLLLMVDPGAETIALVRQRYGNRRLSVLSFGAELDGEECPEDWQLLRMADLLNTDILRHDFLAFLNAWPRQPLVGGKSFDDMFRQSGGYSIWWTGPGAERHPDNDEFPNMRALWLFDRAVRQTSPRQAVLFTEDHRLAWSLASRCRRDGLPYEFLPGSARPRRAPWSCSAWWLGKAIALIPVTLAFVVIRAFFARLLAKTAEMPAAEQERPAVVFASPCVPLYSVHDGRLALYYWQNLSEALRAACPELRQCHLLSISQPFRGYRPILRIAHTGWRLLRTLPGALPICEAFPALRASVCRIPGHLSALFRYWALEKTPALRNSFLFAGADVSPLYLGSLRWMLATSLKWTQKVAAIVESLRAAGNVGAVLINEEMYPSGMCCIAAARQLGIPTVGIQHGTIFPMHLIYTLPPGHVERAPAPDYFAAYGDYAKEVVSRHGAFPAERVWVTGAPRFDHFVKNPPDRTAARRRLELPEDKQVVVVTTQRYPWFQKAVRAIFAAAKQRSDWVVCLKTHPTDIPLGVYRRIAADVGAANVQFFTGQLEDLVAACDVLVTGSSTTMLEAILAGRRTICVNFSGEPDRYPYAADGGAVAARSTAEVGEALERVFATEHVSELAARRQQFLARHVGPTAHGEAAHVLAEKIAALCAKPSHTASKCDP